MSKLTTVVEDSLKVFTVGRDVAVVQKHVEEAVHGDPAAAFEAAANLVTIWDATKVFFKGNTRYLGATASAFELTAVAINTSKTLKETGSVSAEALLRTTAEFANLVSLGAFAAAGGVVTAPVAATIGVLAGAAGFTLTALADIASKGDKLKRQELLDQAKKFLLAADRINSVEGYQSIVLWGNFTDDLVALQTESPILFAQSNFIHLLDPTLTVRQAKALVQASPKFTNLDQSLDFLDELSRVVRGQPTARAATIPEFTELLNTTVLSYAGRTDLRFKLFPTNAGALKDLALSRSDYRSALVRGVPFVIEGQGIDYNSIPADITLYQPSTGNGSLTDKYLTDRATFMARLVESETSGNPFDPVFPGGTRYVDVPLGLMRGPGYPSGPSDLQAQELVVFGGSTGDTITATGGPVPEARIYGLAGADTIGAFNTKMYVEGGDGDDTITGSAFNDELHGGANADTIQGGRGDDIVVGGAGNDSELRGGGGQDVIWGDERETNDPLYTAASNYGGNDRLFGEDGNDQLFGGGGDDQLDGGGSVDYLYGDGSNPEDDTRQGIDTLIGGDDGDFLWGEGGDDKLYGDSTNLNAVIGWRDTLYGGAGNDQLYGGGGDDLLYANSADRTDSLNPGVELLVGGYGKDFLSAASGDDELYGDIQDPDAAGLMGRDDDRLFGRGGDDKLFGGGGKDELFGGEGDDTLRGGTGVGDEMEGGTGHDVYKYKSMDQADFIFDEDADGEVEYDGTTLFGGKSEGAGTFVWFDTGKECTADYIYSTDSDPNAGPVLLKIFRKTDPRGELFIRDFQNGQMGIQLDDPASPPPNPDPDCVKPPPPPAQNPNGGFRGDPLVIDLGASGITTFGLSAGIYFDVDDDGFAERTGFVGPQDGMLVLDGNADGILNDGGELFGEFTRLVGGQLAVNGFQALSQFDRNQDGKIDSSDPIWSSLSVAVWESGLDGGMISVDPSAAMSLRSMSELGIQSISVGSSIVAGPTPDSGGNTKTRSAAVTLTDGSTREVAQYSFVRDTSDTVFIQSVPVPATVAAGPHFSGGAAQMNFQQALARDAEGGYLGKPAGALAAKLDAFTNATDVASFYGLFEQLLFALTGADAIAAGVMTNGLDARHAAVLAKYYGRSFSNPNADQASAWQTAYEELAETLYSSLMAQTHFEEYYEAIDWQHNDATGGQYGNLAVPQAMLDELLAVDPLNGRATVNEFGRTLRGVGLTRTTTYFGLREHFIANPDGSIGLDRSFAFDSVGKPLLAPTDGQLQGWGGTFFSNFTQAIRAPYAWYPYAGGGNDVIYGDDAAVNPQFHVLDSHLVGGAHDNTLVAGPGNDQLFGHEGDDILDGGAGDDLLLGGVGNDTYLFRRGSGRDVIGEADGIDTVFFGSGLTRNDLTVRRAPNGGGTIQISGTDDVLTLPTIGGTIGAGLVAVTARNGIERFAFADGTVLGFNELFLPTPGDDELIGAETNDVIDALAGNDTVNGEAGNDTLIGGEGADKLIGGLGNDTLNGGTGGDTLLGTADDANLLGWYAYYYGIPNGTNGNDTYRFGFGDGHDEIDDFDRTAGNLDTIAFKPGVTATDVTIEGSGDDLILTLSSGDILTVKGHFRFDGAGAIERATFADGTVWTAELSTLTRIGTPGDDVIRGDSRGHLHALGLEGDDLLSGGFNSDLLEGGAGDDVLFGGSGGDTLLGGEGSDSLSGNDGEDLLEGDAGDDDLAGDTGNDVLRGGDGVDVLQGGGGADTYDGGAGNDRLSEQDSTTFSSPDQDVFLFGRGDGHDFLSSRRYNGPAWWMRQTGPNVVVDDVVRFKPGVGPDDVVLFGRRQGFDFEGRTDLFVTLADDPDSTLQIEAFLGAGGGFSANYGSSVGRLEFDDGTVWSYDEIISRLQFRGTPGNDRKFMASERADRIFMLEGDDEVFAGGGNDTVYAGEGNDTVEGGAGDDVIYGEAGNDTLYTGSGNDVVDGGAGNDFVGSVDPLKLAANPGREYSIQRAGDATVLFGHGDGQDTVLLLNSRADSNDTIRLKDDVSLSQVHFVRSGDDLVLDFTDSADALTVRNWFWDIFRVENVDFADGTRLGADDIRLAVLTGDGRNDVIQGYESDDTLTGNGGDDLLQGWEGADTYRFAAGDGADRIVESFESDGSGSGDRVLFDGSVSADDVRVRNERGGMVLTNLLSGDSINVQNQFEAGWSVIEQVEFADGTSWDREMLRALALTATDGDDHLGGFDDSNDELDGLAGDDTLEGGYGEDSYFFYRGAGNDTLLDWGGLDELFFEGVLSSEVTFELAGFDLVITIDDTGESATILDWIGNGYFNDSIDYFSFDDTSLDIFDALSRTGSETFETLFGTPFDDLIEGSDRDSNIFANESDDTVHGNGGRDDIEGDGGNDALFGGDDDDFLSGDDGDDFLAGGRDRDEIHGGRGANQIFLAPGDGLDNVFSEQASVFVRNGLDELYERTVEDLGRLATRNYDATYRSSFWAGQEDDLPPDLWSPTLNFLFGVHVEDAMIALQNLQQWFVTPILDDGFGQFEEFDFQLHAEINDIHAEISSTHFSDYWVNSDLSLLPEDIAEALNAFANEGVEPTAGDDVIFGSAGGDSIFAQAGHDTVLGGKGDDGLHGMQGNDVVGGGDGDDAVEGGPGQDVLAGEAGDDYVRTGPGSDAILFNRGDGYDYIDLSDYTTGDIDTLSLDVNIEDVSAYIDSDGYLGLLVDGGDGGGIFLQWLDFDTGEPLEQPALQRVQFVAADGSARVFDFAALVEARMDDLTAGSYEIPVELFDAADDFEITGSVGIAGGQRAIDYAQTGDLFRGEVTGVGPVANREAEVTLQALQGYLQGVRSGEDGTPLYWLYAEAAKEWVEVWQQWIYDSYDTEFWLEAQEQNLYGFADFVPQDIQDELVAFEDGVSRGQAISALREFEQWLGVGNPIFTGDEIVFGEGFSPEDLSVQVDFGGFDDGDDGDGGEGNSGTATLAIGFGGDDGFLIQAEEGSDGGEGGVRLEDLGVKRFRFADGTVLTLEQVLALADDGVIGRQEGWEDDDFLLGSVADDEIFGDQGNDSIRARGNDDLISGDEGNDIISAGTGDDDVDGGSGDDVIAGERGDDDLRGWTGNDTFAFNRGDGDDYIQSTGGSNDIDTLSFGADIAPEDVSAFADGNFTLLVSGGAGGRIDLEWDAIQRVQFIDANGAIRVFDLAGLIDSLSTQLDTSSAQSPVALFEGAGGFEVTGKAVPAGGDRAVAYAQTGDLFGDAYFASGNEPTDGDDLLFGTDDDDTIEGGAGDDVISAGGGDDDVHAGPGNDVVAGGDGDDLYYFYAGDGRLTIDDDALSSGPNVVVFGPGIFADDLKLGYDGTYLTIDTGTPGDLLRLSGFDPFNPFYQHAVEYYDFDDGTELTYEDLIDRGFDLVGTPGDDILIGTTIEDRIQGLDGEDLIISGEGGDTLQGGLGSDTYLFNVFDGNDVLIDAESDVDHNVVRFGSGISPFSVFLQWVSGDLNIGYGDYEDAITVRDVDFGDATASAPFDRMEFDDDGTVLSLAEILAAGISMFGFEEAETLTGTQGGDYINGRLGDDLLAGGDGSDTYYITDGSGLDTIDDVSDATQSNAVEFDTSLAGSFDDLDITFDRDAHTLTLRILGTDDGVVLTGFDADDAAGPHAVDTFYFDSTGSQYSYQDLLDRGFSIVGTEESDYLRGTSALDYIDGLDGNDVIAGGRGNDIAYGGAGDDVYVFNRGDGVLTIFDDISRMPENTVLFGPGITLDDIRNNLRFIAPDPDSYPDGLLRIGLGDGDEVDIAGFDPDDPENGAHAVETYRFDDGTVVSYRELVLNTFIVQGDVEDDLLFGTNVQDRLYGFEGNDELHAREGNDTLTGGTGDDLLYGDAGADMYVFHTGDGNDVLYDSGENFDGNFISFADDVDPSTIAAVQDGNDMLITYGDSDSIRIVGWDPSHPVIREIRLNNDPATAFTLDQLNNEAPYADYLVSDQVAFEDTPFVYHAQPDPFELFIDPEGAPLSYSVTLANGDALPSWLAFDAASLTFSGTPENIDVGTLEVRLTASDIFGASASQSFSLFINNVNDAAVITDAVGDHSATQGTPFQLVLPTGEFTDPDLFDTLTLSVTLANGDPLPSWLTFDASTGTLSGTPANGDVGALEVRVTATDLLGLSATDEFTLTVENVNDAPFVDVAISDQTATEDMDFSFALDPATFGDVDGDDLATAATLANGDSLPSWLRYDAATMTFSGAPGNRDVGVYAVTVYAADQDRGATSDTFSISVENTNDAPITFAGLLDEDVLEDSPFSFSFAEDAFIDIDAGDSLAFEASLENGDPLPSWIAFDAATATFSGLATNDEVGSYLLRVTATDQAGESDFSLFTLTVVNTNDAPVAFADSNTGSEDDAAVFGNVLDNDVEIDVGDALSVANHGVLSGVYGTLTLASDGSYSYTPGDGMQALAEGQTATDTFSYTATDEEVLSSSTLTITITGRNDAPIVFDTVDGQMATEDSLFSFTLPADTFVDVDQGDTLTYSASGLPAWLSFDAATGTFYGTPTNDDVGTVNLTVRATDTHGEFAESSFTLAVGNVNDNPIAVADSNAVSEDGTPSATGNVLVNDYDIDPTGDVLVVQNPGTFAGTYGTLALALDGTYTYTLTNSSVAVQRLREGQVATDVFAYGASDGQGFTTTTLTIGVTGTNDAPVTVADAASVTEDMLTVASGNVLGNDTDVDAGTTLSVTNAGTYFGTYGTLTLNGNGTYSYTLNNSSAAVQSLRAGQTVSDVFGYTASDTIASTTGTLTISVNGRNDAPVTVNDSAAATEDVLTTATGNVLTNDTDIDSGTTLSVGNAGTYSGTYGTLVLSGNGSYTYTLNNSSAAVQALAAGQSVTDTFGYSASDGTVSTNATLVVTITGTNDAPVVQADAASVQEDVVLNATGNVLANDTDVDTGSTVTISNFGTYTGVYGTLTLNSNGTYSYALNNASTAVQALRGGQTATDAFSYTATDGIASTSGTLNISVAGRNDAPLTLNDAASVQEDVTTSASGNLLDNDRDVDAGTILSVTAGSFAGTYGSLNVAANGAYTYTLNNTSAAVQSLRAGQLVGESFVYFASDGLSSTSGILTVVVAGANDVPTLSAALADQNVDAGEIFTLVVPANTFTDVDQGDTLTYSASLADGAALPTWLSFDAATRTFSGTAPGDGSCDCGCDDDEPGSTDNLQIRVTATDGSSASASDIFALSIAGGSSSGVNLVGTAGNDTLTGTACDDTLDGRAGTDTLRGMAGDDTLIYSVDGEWTSSSNQVENVGSPGVPGTGEKVKLKDHQKTLDLYDGGAGYDVLTGGSTDDALRLDTGGSGPQLIGVERISMGSGDDIVDLTSRRFAYGDVTIEGGSGDDVLWSSAGNDILVGGTGDDELAAGAGSDVLAGGEGDDWLQGGTGNDVYVYELGGDDDTIKDSGGSDTLVFGAGVTSQTVSLSRHGNDLEVRVGGAAGGKVTMEDWFKSSTNRIEKIQFANGTTWNESQIRDRVDHDDNGHDGHDDGHGSDGGHGTHGNDNDCGDGHGGSGHGDHDDRDDDERNRDQIADAIAQRLRNAPRFDFDALIKALGQSKSSARAMTPAEIARRWSLVQGFADDLGEAGHDAADRAALLASQRNLFSGVTGGAGGWGYDGSVGAQHGSAPGLQGFNGLSDGFKKL